MSIWGWIKGWRLDKVFKSIKNNAAKVAIAITEAVKTALNSGVVDFIATVVSTVLPQLHNLPQEIISKLNKLIPKILAAELAVQGLPDNPTEEQILAFENNILDAFGLHDNKSKLYTVLASQIYGILKVDLDAGAPMTFAQLVIDIETAYNLYLKDKAEFDNTTTVLASDNNNVG